MENIHLVEETNTPKTISTYSILEQNCKKILTQKISREEFLNSLDIVQNIIEDIEIEYTPIFIEDQFSKEFEKSKEFFYEAIDLYKKSITEIEVYLDDNDENHITRGLDMALRGNEILITIQEFAENKGKEVKKIKELIREHIKEYAIEDENFPILESLDSLSEEERTDKEKLEKSRKKSEILSLIPLFSILGEKQLEKLDKRIKFKKYEKGKVLFNEGDKIDELYIVKSGNITVYKLIDKEENNIKNIATLSKGDILGEIGIILNSPRTLSARVTSDSAELYVISRGDFLYMVQKYPDFSLNLCKILCRRIISTTNKVILS
jgi:CRP-like cAMP-binding protein